MDEGLKRRVVRGMVRRKQALPPLLGFALVRPGVWRATCEESGDWTEWDVTGSRIRRVGENDPSAPKPAPRGG